MTEEKKTSRDGGDRQVYAKPRLRRVQLAAGEVLAEGCKLTDGGRNVGIDNISCTQPTVCVSAGS